MFFLKLEFDKAMAEKNDTKEKQYEATRTVEVTKGTAGRGCSGGLRKDRPAVQTPPAHPPLVTDSEWLALSPEEQLAWAQNTQDPRIAVGSQSPLEKKIKSLGGVHSSEVRRLLVQKFQQENETLHKLKATSFDFWFAKTEEYYSQRHQEMMQEEEWEDEMVPRWDMKIKEEETRPQSEKTQDAKKWDYLVSERELKQIEKHIHRAEQARGLRDHEYRLVPQRIPREVLFTNPSTLEKDEKVENIHKTPKAKTKMHKVEWTKEQIKKHQDRMIRGRELTKQRNDQQGAQKLDTQAPPLLKSQVQKEEVKEFEQVTAYPIVQPHPEALIEVTILREKSKEESKIKKPLRRELLCIPPFLKSQLEKNKVKNIF